MKQLLSMLVVAGSICASAGCQSWYVEQKRTPVPGGYLSSPPATFERSGAKDKK